MKTLPIEVRTFGQALADWLTSFTVPERLASEMAAACAEGAEWVSAIAGASSRRSGWEDAEALAWGISAGAQAGALIAAAAAIRGGAGDARGSDGSGDGSSDRLLAADALIAGSYEALGSLPAERLATAASALADEMGEGGVWSRLAEDPRVGWAALVPLALAPAAKEDPEGPWIEYRARWRERSPISESPWRHPGADDALIALMHGAFETVSGRGPGG